MHPRGMTLKLRALTRLLTGLALLGIALTTVMAEPLEGLHGNAILDHLNVVINWYRHAMTRVPTVGLPSDSMYQYNAQTMAAQAAQLAFQSASAEAPLLPNPGPANPATSGQSSSSQNLSKLQSDTDARITALKVQVSDLTQQISSAHKAQLPDLTAQRTRAQGELELREAMHDALAQMNTFISTNGESSTGGLEGSINELRRSVPELSNSDAAKNVAKPGVQATGSSAGLIGEVVSLYELLEGRHQITQLTQETEHVKQTAEKLRAPLTATLRATIQQGEQLANQTGTTDVDRKQFDVLAARFKQIAKATLPLSQEIILLDQSNANLVEWGQSLEHESHRIFFSILWRVASITLAIGVILLLSEIWRRITFRYIADVRRRRQFLLLRRIVVSFCMGIVLILGFVSEFSSLATFAGFITAGLAVGLQTILLSVAAYFFLVGRWGIRVGDRISVAGVTGEVVDVGLVRLYLMELAGTGVELYQTGRIVVFSNSVLFQATTPLFKQLPGSEYAWHEVSVALNPDSKFDLVESQVIEAVHSIHMPYGQELQRQLGTTERNIDIQMKVPEPHGQLQYTDTGLEYVVRYPVGLHQIAEADEKVTRKLLELLQQQPDLRASISGFPKIRAAVKG